MKRLIIYILLSTVVLFAFSSVIRYDSSDGITDNRGWPIGYYRWQTVNESNLDYRLCMGADVLVTGPGPCNNAPPAIVYARLAINFLIWLMAGGFIGGLYLLTSKRKNT